MLLVRQPQRRILHVPYQNGTGSVRKAVQADHRAKFPQAGPDSTPVSSQQAVRRLSYGVRSWGYVPPEGSFDGVGCSDCSQSETEVGNGIESKKGKQVWSILPEDLVKPSASSDGVV